MPDGPRIQELRRRVQLDPASIAFAALAEEYRRAGRFEEAVAACQAGLHRHPSYLSARVTLGRSLLEIGRFDEAQQELEQVLKLAPENLAAIRGLAEIQHRRTGAGPQGSDTPGREAPPAPAVQAPELPLRGHATGAPVGDLLLNREPGHSPAADASLKREAVQPIGPDLGLVPGALQARAAEALGSPLAPAADVTPARASVPEPTRVDDSPALARLEEFLSAIVRARAGRTTAR